MSQAEPPDGKLPQKNVNVREAVLEGGAWIFLGRWIMRGLGIVSTIILARLLAPEDFGLMALSVLLVGLAEVIGRYGPDAAVIRRQNLDRDYMDSAWTVALITGIVLGVCVFASAPLIAAYFNEPRAILLVQILSVRVFSIGLHNMGVVLFQKDLNFGKDITVTMLEKLLPAIITLVSAYFIRNYWALVIGNIVGFAGAIAVSYAIHPYRPKICFKYLADVWSFSFWVLMQRLAMFASMRLDSLFVPAVGNTSSLGHYHVGSELARMPVGELFMPLDKVLYAAYARLIHEPGGLRNAYLTTVSTGFMICLPVSFGFALVAGDFVAIIYGEKWIPMIPVVEIIAFASGAMALTGTVTPVLLAIGKSRLSASLIFLQALLLLSALLLLQSRFDDITDIALVRLSAVMIVLPIALICVQREISLPLIQVLKVCWRPVVAVCAMTLVLLHVTPQDMDMPAALRLAARVAAGAAAYAGVLLLTWLLSGKPEGAERTVLNLLGQRPGKQSKTH